MIGELIKLDKPVRTVKQAARAMGVSESKIVKTLVVKCGGEYRAYIVRGNRRLDLERLNCQMVKPDEVLAITGYPAGGVPPILNIPTYIDPELLQEDYVYGGGGDDYTLLKFKPKDLVERGLVALAW